MYPSVDKTAIYQSTTFMYVSQPRVNDVIQ